MVNPRSEERQRHAAYVEIVRCGSHPCVCGCDLHWHGYADAKPCVSGVFGGCDEFRLLRVAGNVDLDHVRAYAMEAVPEQDPVSRAASAIVTQAVSPAVGNAWEATTPLVSHIRKARRCRGRRGSHVPP